MAKVLVALLVLLVSSFTVFAEKVLPPTSQPALAPPPPYPHPPTPSPVYPPTHSPVHHNHSHHRHHYPPSPTPTPAPAPAPVKPPVHPPTPAPTPTHPHYPPTPSPTPSSPVNPPHHSPVPVPHPVPPPVVHPFPRSFVSVQGVVFTKSCKYAGIDTLLGATPALGAIVKLQCYNTKYRLVQTAKTDKNGYFFFEAPKSITNYGAHKCNVFLVSAPTGLKPSNLHGGVTGAVLKPEKPYISLKKLPFLLYSVGPLAFEPKCPY